MHNVQAPHLNSIVFTVQFNQCTMRRQQSSGFVAAAHATRLTCIWCATHCVNSGCSCSATSQGRNTLISSRTGPSAVASAGSMNPNI